MTALLLAVLLTQAHPVPCASAATDPPGPCVPLDAPVVPRPAVVLLEGQPVPFNATCMDDALTMATGKRLASCEATVTVAKASGVLVPTPVFVSVVASAAVAIITAVSLGVVVAKQAEQLARPQPPK